MGRMGPYTARVSPDAKRFWETLKAGMENTQTLPSLALALAKTAWRSLGEFILLLAMSFGVVALVKYCIDADDEWLVHLDSSTSLVGTIGAMLMFSVAFRLNVCMARWWEGRCLWEKLVYAAINATQQARVWFEDEKLLRCFTNMVVVFSWTCKAQLRGNRLEDEGEEGKVGSWNEKRRGGLVKRGLLEQEELDQMSSENLQDGWQPQYCLDIIRSVVHQEFNSRVTRWQYGMLIEKSVADLAQAISGLIRVKSTGMPQTYDVGLKALVVLYCVVCNFAYAHSLGWYTPIMTFAIYFILWSLLKMGTVLLDPFGVDPVDHPLDSYCSLIEAQCKAVRERHGKVLYQPPLQRAAAAAAAAAAVAAAAKTS